MRGDAKLRLKQSSSYAKAEAKGDTEKMRQYAQVATTMKPYMVPESKKLLDLMGLPWIQAPSEGEAQAAYMNKKGDADYCASQDYDSLLFGAPKLLRNVQFLAEEEEEKPSLKWFPKLLSYEKRLVNAN